MANSKQNKVLARCVVVGGTLLASLGIWTSIVNHAAISQAAVVAPLSAVVQTNVNTPAGNAPNTGTPAQTTQPPAQTTPADTTPAATTPAGTTPPATTTIKPAPATTIPPAAVPVRPPPPPPTVITRGS